MTRSLLTVLVLLSCALFAGEHGAGLTGKSGANHLHDAFGAERLDMRKRLTLAGGLSALEKASEADSLTAMNLADSSLRKDPSRLAWVLFVQAMMAKKHNNFNLALSSVRASRKVYEESGDLHGRLYTEVLEGSMLVIIGDIAMAVPLMNRALLHSKDLGDTFNWIISLSRLAAINGIQENLQGARKNYQESVRMASAYSDRAIEAIERHSLAELWHRLGEEDSCQREMDRSRRIFLSCCASDSSQLSKMQYFKAMIAADHNEFKQALDTISPWQDWFDRQKKWPWATFLRAIRSGWLLKSGKAAEAAKVAEEGYRIAREQNLMKETMDNLFALHMAEAALGNYRRAYAWLLEFHQLRDSIITSKGIDQMATLEQKFRHERELLADSLRHQKKTFGLELEREQAESTRNVYLFIGLGVLLLATGLWFRLRDTRRAKAAIEKEKQISESLLLNILPEEVAAELKEKGSAEAQLIDQVTVLFTDFKGFTEYSEKMDPAGIVHDLHECFSAFDGIVERFGIEKIKTIGDAYMAAGGLPTPNTTHACDVIYAALAMRDFVAEQIAKKTAAGKPFFEIRIGMHTGPVVAGIVGVKKFSYDIWGDTVNTASRMESSGEVGQVNISEDTYNNVKTNPKFRFTSRGKVKAKGKGEMEMYFVNYQV